MVIVACVNGGKHNILSAPSVGTPVSKGVQRLGSKVSVRAMPPAIQTTIVLLRKQPARAGGQRRKQRESDPQRRARICEIQVKIDPCGNGQGDDPDRAQPLGHTPQTYGRGAERSSASRVIDAVGQFRRRHMRLQGPCPDGSARRPALRATTSLASRRSPAAIWSDLARRRVGREDRGLCGSW